MTITSNVWYNLSAWASGSFALGQRCSNAGKAYQCITAGSSTAAPTGTGSTINNGGAAVFKFLSTVDYTSFNAYCNVQPGAQTDNAIVQGWNGRPGTTVNVAANSGIITYFGVSAGSFTTLFCCAPGESFRDQGGADPLEFNPAAGLSFTCPASGAQAPAGGAWVYCSVNNVTLDGLQILDPQNSGAMTVNFSGANCLVRGCVLETSYDGGADTVQCVYMAAANTNIINSFVKSNSAFSSTVHTIKWEIDAGINGHAVGCTIILTTPSIHVDAICGLGSAGQVIVSNCAIFGYSNPINSQNVAGAVVVDHCCFGAASLANNQGLPNTDNGGNLYSKTAANEFLNAATDFRIKASADLVRAGATDTAYIPVGDDIFRFVRTSPWDIGAAAYRPPSALIQSVSSLIAEADAVLADGQSPKAITEARVRQLIDDFIASALDVLSGGASLVNYANDAAAATGGVPINGLYRNGSSLMVRVS